jgi:hypothetical protein
MNEQQLIELINSVKDRWGRETVAAIIQKIREENLVFNGTLERSISYEQDAAGEISFFMADYGVYQDQGVNGTEGQVGSQFQFKGNWKGTAFHLKEWATAKNLNPYAVAKSIQKKGIQPKKFFTSVVESRLNVLGESINQSITDYMTMLINRQQTP